MSDYGQYISPIEEIIEDARPPSYSIRGRAEKIVTRLCFCKEVCDV